MKNRILAFIAIFILCISIVYAENAWKLEKNKDGIKIWTRKMVNSNLKEYKGSVIIQTKTEKLLAFLKNYSAFDKWMYKADVGSLKLVKKVNENDFYFRLTMSAPFIKSRESVTHFVMNQADENGIILINLTSTPDLIPLNENYVRIPKWVGFWKIVPLGNDKIEVIHQAQIAAGGTIPDALANLGAVDAPYSMLYSLKEIFR